MEHLFNLLEKLNPNSFITDLSLSGKKQLSISVSNTIKVKNMSLKNLNNEEIKLSFKFKNQLITSNVAHLESGTYFIEIKSNKGINYRKICIN